MAIRAIAAAIIVAGIASSVSAADAVSGPTIAIKEYAFVPATLTVPKGTKITFVNEDDVPHNVAASDKSFHSPALDTNDTWSKTFDQPGTYQYFCVLHPFMTGTVVVTP